MEEFRLKQQHAATKVSSHSRLPLQLGLAYLLFTIFLFFFGPFDWPLPSYFPITIYLTALLGMLTIGHMMGLKRTALHAPLPSRELVFLIGGLSAISLIVPSSIVYTGRWPWQVFEALADQRDAYESLREQLVETQGSRGAIIAIRTLTYPFVFSVLPLGVIYWKTLTKFQKTLLILTVLSNLIFSALRGTTRELADVVIIAAAALLISLYRGSATGPLKAVHTAKYVFRIGLLGAGVLVALIARTAARMSGPDTWASDCIGEAFVCVSYDKFPYNFLPFWTTSSISTITGYFSQGYYGLALAFNHDFVWTWGAGHSPAIQTLVQIFNPNTHIVDDTYISRLSQDGWSGDYQWSTLATWFASDISFWLVPGVMLIIGYVWARSWVDATIAKDDRAAVVFCASMMIIFYFPANNQMMNTLDNYAALLGWVFAWRFTRRNAIRVAA